MNIPMGGVAVIDEIYNTVTNASPEAAPSFRYTYSAYPQLVRQASPLKNLSERGDIWTFIAQKIISTRLTQDHPLVADIRGIGSYGVGSPRFMSLADVEANYKDMFFSGLHEVDGRYRLLHQLCCRTQAH